MEHPDPLIIWVITVLEFFGCAVMIWIHGFFAGQGKLKGWEKKEKEAPKIEETV